jgi:phosphopantothenoylcysteine decarboxylase/phosphopantothenate--cysteine ligase
MYEAVDARFNGCDILIMSAAVSDYRPVRRSDHKVKKDKLELTIEMEPTVDILKTVAARKKANQFVVGFAAETDDVENYARGKMLSKNCDLMVANRVGVTGGGFMSDTNSVLLLGRDGSREEIATASKAAIAERIVQAAAQGYAKKRG